MRLCRVLRIQAESPSRLQHAKDFLEHVRLILDPMEHAVEVDHVELTRSEFGEILRTPDRKHQPVRCTRLRDRNPVGQWINRNHRSFRRDLPGDMLSEPPGSGPDIEHELARLY